MTWLDRTTRALPEPIRVRVLSGRWAGRDGTMVGWHVNPGNPGGQQGQDYPIVNLDARGRAAARTVRVVTVKALCAFVSPSSEDGYCPCSLLAGHTEPHNCIHGYRR